MTAATLPFTDRRRQVPAPCAQRVHLADQFGCPVCTRPIYTPCPRGGLLWMACNLREVERRGSCRGHWLNITVPSRASVRDLSSVVGQDEAIAMARVVRPELRAAAPIELLELLLAPHAPLERQTIHLQVVCRPRDEHLFRYAPVGDFLRAVGVSRAA